MGQSRYIIALHHLRVNIYIQEAKDRLVSQATAKHVGRRCPKVIYWWLWRLHGTLEVCSAAAEAATVEVSSVVGAAAG